TIGDHGGVRAFLGAVTITDVGEANLAVHDSSVFGRQVILIGSSSVTGAFGPAPTINFTGSQLAALTVEDGMGDDLIVVDTSAPTTIETAANAFTSVGVVGTTQPLTIDQNSNA